MPIIENPIEFSQQLKDIIATKLKTPNFQHTNWSDDDLEPARQEIRNYYRKEQRLTCIYCKGPISIRSASGANIEHIVPKSANIHFIFESKNLCVICPDCNEYKGKREVLAEPVTTSKNKIKYPSKSSDFRIMHPHFDDYEDHILKANRIYVERSDKGGYTIYICNLNRFFRKFGRCEEYVNDIQIIEQAERFHNVKP